jgi:D-proline reductase (dithiol) PrdB
MPRLDSLPEILRNTLLTHTVIDNEDAPWAPLRVPLRQAHVALVTTAGLHRRGDAPFTRGDQSFRTIAADCPDRDIVVSHVSIGFDRSGLQRDLNLVFPRERLQEMAAAGEIGALNSRAFSFMGAQRSYDRLIEESAPEVARLLLDDGAQAVLLTGA